MRRRIRREFTWSSGSWAQTNEVRYVCDGGLVIQERSTNNTPLVTYTRGLDLSGSLQGAGGIGGLLARSEPSARTAQTAFYHADGNGNITCLINTNQLIVAKYLYDPFGYVLLMSGPLAAANVYRFSSKEIHVNSGTIYYLYRYYDPSIQRWLNRDPIGESGGINAFRYVLNDPLNLCDLLGLKPNDKFATIAAAQMDASRTVYPMTLKDNHEHGGWLYHYPDSEGGWYSYSPPGDPPDPNPDHTNLGPSPGYYNIVGYYHSHLHYAIENVTQWAGLSNEDFSDADKEVSEDHHKIIATLVTPSGCVKQYTPIPHLIRAGPTTVVGNISDPIVTSRYKRSLTP